MDPGNFTLEFNSLFKAYKKVVGEELDYDSEGILVGDVVKLEELANKKAKEKYPKKHKKITDQLYEEWTKQELLTKLDTPAGRKAVENFTNPNLLNEIHKELDYKHKKDHKEKLAVFLTAITGYLKNPDDHCSGALKGDSSSGKDNCIKTTLSHLPSEDTFMLTRATRSALEDNIQNKKIIAFSEINKHREDGANSEITETFKQLADGGVCVIKKDSATGYKTSIKIDTEQKTLLYGTTETESDEELETRYVIIPIRGSEEKNKIVANDVFKKARDPEAIINKTDGDHSWIAMGIKNLLAHDINVIIPFTEAFETEIKDTDGKEKYLFDYSRERVKRDVKRLLSLTKAITWLYQKQRVQFEKEGHKFVYSEPTDFLTALTIFADFFNLTYSGLDHRLQTALEKIRELEGKHDGEILNFGYENKYYGWVLRHKLQESLGIQSINTIKERISKLKDFQLVETHYDTSKPRGYLIKGVNQGVNRVSLPISLTALTPYLTGYLTPYNWYKNKKLEKISLDFIEENIEDKQNSIHISKLTPSKLTPSKSKDIHTPKIKEETISDVLDWEEKAVVWQPCAYPKGDDTCGDSPCNEFKGLFYCKEHFELISHERNHSKEEVVGELINPPTSNSHNEVEE